MADVNKLHNWLAVAPIHNLFVPDVVVTAAIQNGEAPLVPFSEEAGIFYLSVDEEKRLYNLEMIRRVGRARWSDRFYAFKVKYQEVDDETTYQKQQLINERIDTMLDAMRVYAHGDIYLGGVAHWKEIGDTGITNLFSRSWPQTFQPFALIDTEYISDLVAFYHLIGSMIKKGGNLGTAIHWFSRACEEERLDDKVISLMTVAEALSKAPYRGKAEHVSTYIADSFVADGQNRAVIKEKAEAAYNLRNSYLHNGVISDEWERRYPSLATDPYSLIAENGHFLRTILQKIIK